MEKDANNAERLTVRELMREIAKLGLRTPDESTRMIREDRDAR
jgi:hypothetical protein